MQGNLTSVITVCDTSTMLTSFGYSTTSVFYTRMKVRHLFLWLSATQSKSKRDEHLEIQVFLPVTDFYLEAIGRTLTLSTMFM